VNAKSMYDANYSSAATRSTATGRASVRRQPRLPAHPNADAPSVFAWVHIGTTVDVYR